MRLIELERDTIFTLQNQSAVKGHKLGLCQSRTQSLQAFWSAGQRRRCPADQRA